MPTTPTSLSSHRLVPMGERPPLMGKEGQVANLQLHSLHSSCIGWSLQVSLKAAEEKASEDSLEHVKTMFLFFLQDYMILLFPLLK